MSFNVKFTESDSFEASFSPPEEHHAEMTEQTAIPIPGPPGPQGDPGISPTITVTDIAGGHRITITDAQGTQTFDVMDGAEGAAGHDGQDGADGISPVASVSKAGNTATITVTDRSGTTTATVSDGRDGSAGKDGAAGKDGKDGISPSASVTKSGGTATITITDANGTTTATVSDGTDGRDGSNGRDGSDGRDGADGHSPVITATKTSGVTTIYSDGTAIATVNDGEDGAPGETGPQGPAGTTDYNDLSNKPTIPTKTSDLTNDSGYISGMYIASYGASTWADVLAAYNANKVVYCRASSNANPATGVQGRMAFLAYVGFSGNNPSSFEFQYYRSVNGHSDSQQGDQVFIYTLKSTGWTVTTREAYTKIVAGTGLTSTYSNGVLTIKLA